MSLDEEFETKEELSNETTRILNLPEIKNKYMKKYDLTHQEYIDCMKISKEWAFDQGLSFTLDYFNESMNKRQELIKLFTKKKETIKILENKNKNNFY